MALWLGVSRSSLPLVLPNIGNFLSLAGVGIWGRSRSWCRARVVIAACAAIALTGLFQTVQRVLESIR
jgi:hypothetical protein